MGIFFSKNRIRAAVELDLNASLSQVVVPTAFLKKV